MSDIEINAPKEIDFEAVGFMSGLEFHQQIKAPYDDSEDALEHGSKLFCACPAYLRDDDPDFTILRQLRAVAGETGDVDVSAMFEKLKQSDTIYEGYEDTTCLIELDEEPIFPINPEALYRTLTIARQIFHLELVDEIQVNRKTIIDGSNTSGFQRTAMIAYGSDDSFIEVNGKNISIYQANLEEDSAKNVGRDGDTRKFRLDRLGIPLIEVATGPDMSTPAEVLATAQRIGELLRTTGFVKRGQGTIRQDLNVSISRGNRIEIKGVSELELLPEYVKNEAIRQKRMLDLLDIFKSRNISKRRVAYIKPKDLTPIFEDCKAKFVKKALDKGQKVVGARLPSCSGLLKYELQPDYRFGTELSEVCKVTAGVGGILHSDELPKFGITEEELDQVKKELNVKDDDGYFFVITSEDQGNKAVIGVRTAFQMWLDQDGIVPEVRAPRGDGTTGYLRPLPGKARMYPETDSRPIHLTKELQLRIESTEFELPEERIERYTSEFGISQDLAEQLAIHPKNDLFEELVANYEVDATLVASTLLSTLVNLRREGLDTTKINRSRLHEVFKLVAKDEISKDAVELVLTEITKQKGRFKLVELIAKLGIEKMDESAIEEIIQEVVDEHAELINERGMGAMGTIMGKAMAKLSGNADGQTVSAIVRNLIQNS